MNAAPTVLLANPRGFCAGVDRAIEIVERALEHFGAPIYVRGRHLAEATARTQESVEQLVLEGDLTWWTVERRRQSGQTPAAGRPAPRWRRLWDQAAPDTTPRGRIWG